MDMPERLGLQNYLQLAFKKYSGFLQAAGVNLMDIFLVAFATVD